MATMKLGSKAEAFQLEGHTWICTNELASDVTIEIGEMSFHLHKFPLLNKSGLLQKLITECNNGEGKPCVIQLHDIPGGAKAFELVAKFCYDIKMELNAHNAVYLRCAAEYLKMTEEYVGNNLISQTEALLTEVFSNWKDSIKVLEKCEYVLPQAEDLHIVNRCINSLATKACADPALFAWPMVGRISMKSPGGTALWNGICTGERKSSSFSSTSGVADWWYQDVSFLSLPLYKRLIVAMESKSMKPESIAGSLMFYARRYLPGLNRSSSFRDGANNRIVANAAVSAPSDSDQRGLLEEIVAMLPMKKGVSSTKFLLGLLRTAMLLKAGSSCRENLEMRVGTQLEEAALEDLLIPNLGYSVETLYDIDCVQRMLDHFMVAEQSSAATSPGIVDEGHLMSGNSSVTPMSLVAKLIDGYLAEVAPDVNLKFNKFQALAAVIPDCARTLDDGIYRAIDIFLKSHPWLTDSEREQLCRLMNCQKLSLEACTHAAQNERLPLRVVVQVLFFEQLRLRTSIAGWFFVSDNLENPHGAHGSLMTQKNNSDGVRQTEITQENKEEDELLVSSDEMKVRVSELERECLSMKHDIQKLGKHKSSWSLFSKLRLGSKSQPH